MMQQMQINNTFLVVIVVSFEESDHRVYTLIRLSKREGAEGAQLFGHSLA